MADNKIEKALYGPSTTEVALGAGLGLVVGVVAACVFLVFKPVQSVKALPKEQAKGAVYYIPGSDSPGRAQALPGKLRTLTAGGTASFNEDELNVWAASLGAPAAKPGAAPGAAKAPPPEGFLTASAPNFRIVDGKLQVGFRVTLNYFGLIHEFTAFATGRFTSRGEVLAFEPDTFYFGSCPLHKLPVAAGFVTSRLVGSQKVPDDIRAGWAKVREAVIEGGQLKLTTSS